MTHFQVFATYYILLNIFSIYYYYVMTLPVIAIVLRSYVPEIYPVRRQKWVLHVKIHIPYDRL